MNKTFMFGTILFFGVLVLILTSQTACYSSGGHDLDPTTDDTCSICEVVILPDNIVLSIGESVQFTAAAYSFEDERIIGGPQILFSSSSMACYINPFSGQVRTYASTGNHITITATAYDCSGRPVKGEARVLISTSPGGH